MMCGFFAQHIFNLPRLQNVTYYMRLDSDAYIFEPLCYDPIERFHRRNLLYANRSAHADDPWVTRGMWNFVDNYARANSDVETTMKYNKWVWPKGRDPEGMKEAKFPMYYNNFEIVRLEAF